MNKGGLVLVIAGTLVLCQVLGGNALTRLGVIGPAAQNNSDTSNGGFPQVPDKGYSNVPHDAQGNPL